MDYLLTFTMCADAGNLDDVTSKLVAIVERTHSSMGGGIDLQGGEFFIDADPHFTRSDLLEMIGTLLPITTSLTITEVLSEASKRRRSVSASAAKRSGKKFPGARRAPSSRETRMKAKV